MRKQNFNGIESTGNSEGNRRDSDAFSADDDKDDCDDFDLDVVTLKHEYNSGCDDILGGMFITPQTGRMESSLKGIL